jgi:hypothetical protein
MLNAIMLNVVMLNVIILSVVMLNVIILSIVMLNVIMLCVIMLNVIMLNVIAPAKQLQKPLNKACQKLKSSKFCKILQNCVNYFNRFYMLAF